MNLRTDYKTGWIDYGNNQSQRSYCLCLTMSYPFSTASAIIVTSWLWPGCLRFLESGLPPLASDEVAVALSFEANNCAAPLLPFSIKRLIIVDDELTMMNLRTDYKTGWIDYGNNQSQRSYCLCLTMSYPFSTASAIIVTSWLWPGCLRFLESGLPPLASDEVAVALSFEANNCAAPLLPFSVDLKCPWPACLVPVGRALARKGAVFLVSFNFVSRNSVNGY